MKFLIEGPR